MSLSAPEARPFIQALLRQPVSKTPIWLMRQAGRYLPEYKKLRTKAKNFMDFCRTPSLAMEAVMQPLARFDLDAAILFSDILTIPDVIGTPVRFIEGQGPVIDNPIKSARDVDVLKNVDVNDALDYVMHTVSGLRKNLSLDMPLIGFSGSPFTLACYMVEGSGSKTFSQTKALMYKEPKVFHALLDKLARIIVDYLNAQIEHGADAVMVFDTWGGILSNDDYQTFSLQYMQYIIEHLIKEKNNQRVPNIIFTKGGGLWLEKMARIGVDALGLDWTVSLNDAIKRVGDKVALQGNLDPSVLYGSAALIKQRTQQILQQAKAAKGFVFNLGHGVYPDISPDKVKVLVDTVNQQEA